MLTLALSKGRIFDESLPLLAAAGIEVLEDPERSRGLEKCHATVSEARRIPARHHAETTRDFMAHDCARRSMSGKKVQLVALLLAGAAWVAACSSPTPATRPPRTAEPERPADRFFLARAACCYNCYMLRFVAESSGIAVAFALCLGLSRTLPAAIRRRS